MFNRVYYKGLIIKGSPPGAPTELLPLQSYCPYETNKTYRIINPQNLSINIQKKKLLACYHCGIRKNSSCSGKLFRQQRLCLSKASLAFAEIIPL